MTSETLISSVRAQLEAERAHIVQQLSELGVNDEALDFDVNFADSAQVAAEQGEARALASSLEENLKEIDAALERLEAGTYGSCAQCGQPIAEARLEAIPTARLCISCAA